MLSTMATDAARVEWYLDRHPHLVAFDCEERGARAVALELAAHLGITYRVVISAMRERCFIVPASLDQLEAA